MLAELARQWLADAAGRGQINPGQHHTWAQLVNQARGSQQHAQWRIDNGLDPAPTPRTDEHLAGHAGQHHRSGDRHLGNAVDNPHTPDVDE